MFLKTNVMSKEWWCGSFISFNSRGGFSPVSLEIQIARNENYSVFFFQPLISTNTSRCSYYTLHYAAAIISLQTVSLNIDK